MKRNSHSSAENVERPIQDKPKKKHGDMQISKIIKLNLN